MDSSEAEPEEEAEPEVVLFDVLDVDLCLVAVASCTSCFSNDWQNLCAPHY